MLPPAVVEQVLHRSELLPALPENSSWGIRTNPQSAELTIFLLFLLDDRKDPDPDLHL